MQFCLARSFRCTLLNITPRLEPVGAICQPSKSGSGDDDRLKFIRCVGGRQLEIHEVWNFGDDRITPKVNPFARVDVDAFVRDCFVTDNLTGNGHRVLLFGRKWTNGSFDWMGVCDFMRTDEPHWTDNLLAP